MTFAKVLGINFVDPTTGREYEPTSAVTVSVKLLDEDVSRADRVSVVHFRDTAQSSATRPAHGL